MKKLTRREFLSWSALAGAGVVLTAGTGQFLRSNQDHVGRDILI